MRPAECTSLPDARDEALTIFTHAPIYGWWGRNRLLFPSPFNTIELPVPVVLSNDSLGSYSASPPLWKGSPRQPGDVGEAA
jgi:hypothetical protein